MTDVNARAAHLLGGTRTFRKRRMSTQDWIYAIRKGFPVSALDSLRRNVNATNAELAQMLGISVRALAWRRRKGILTPFESERLYRVARVVGRVEEVFGNLTNGLAWLKSPNISLGGFTPISLLDTYVGGDWVVDTLGRIEHGIVA